MIIKNNMSKLYIANFKIEDAVGDKPARIARVRLNPGLNQIDDELFTHLEKHPSFKMRLEEPFKIPAGTRIANSIIPQIEIIKRPVGIENINKADNDRISKNGKFLNEINKTKDESKSKVKKNKDKNEENAELKEENKR